MNRPLQKLITTARKAPRPQPPPAETPAPFGFSTRVAAHWSRGKMAARRADLWEHCCWWVASASVAMCIVVTVQHALQPEPDAFDLAFTATIEVADYP